MHLLDTNALLWWVTEPRRIPSAIRGILSDPAQDVFYSVIGPWELSIKHAKGKLPLPKNFFPTLPKLGFDCLPVTDAHVEALCALPKLHGDPFDRMLIAQAHTEKMTLITSDKRLAAYPIKTLLIKP